MTQSRVVSSLLSVLPTSQVFTSGYVNMETILHFFYKITNERGTKTMFTYADAKWFYGQSECVYYLNYFIMRNINHSVKKIQYVSTLLKSKVSSITYTVALLQRLMLHRTAFESLCIGQLTLFSS